MLLLVLLGVVAVSLVVAAVALRPLARSKTREALAGMKGARGDFQDVDVSLFPLRYTITRLKITQKDALLPDPSFYAERLTVTLRWSSLLRGVFAGDLDGERAKLVLEEPKPGPDTPMPGLAELVPVRAVLERAQFRDSENPLRLGAQGGLADGLGAPGRGHAGEPRLTTGPDGRSDGRRGTRGRRWQGNRVVHGVRRRLGRAPHLRWKRGGRWLRSLAAQRLLLPEEGHRPHPWPLLDADELPVRCGEADRERRPAARPGPRSSPTETRGARSRSSSERLPWG